MSLTLKQQKQLYEKLYDSIIDLHSIELRNNLKDFTKIHREKMHKGIVLLDFIDIKDMINSVKNKFFEYKWVPKNQANHIKHASIPTALTTMNAKSDCILVCSLALGPRHLYVDCMKFKDFDLNI